LKEVIESHWVFESTYKQKPKGPQDKNIEEGIVIDTEEKILAIICAYMTNIEFANFSLTVDGNYIGQNSVRILRCIFELAVKKNMAQLTELTLKWCRCLEHRIVPSQLPLY
jgi:activating signal cointegrator complex subunit 3